MDDMTFMKATYGLSENELSGLDLEALISDYQLRTRNYSAEEVRKIIRDEGDMYQFDPAKPIFALLDSEENGGLTSSVDIKRIGFYRNSGTLREKVVFDLENNVYYHDTSKAVEMSPEQTAELKSMPQKYDIFSWDKYYEGKEQQSTGSLRWKLVFEASDGSIFAYGGYTGDMSHLPKTYFDVYDVMKSVYMTE